MTTRPTRAGAAVDFPGLEVYNPLAALSFREPAVVCSWTSEGARVRFVQESRIKATPARVFAFHESPGALRRLTPPWEKVVVESGGDSIRVGSRVVLRTQLGPVPLRWVAEHVAYEPPHGFADVQRSGPFRRWHHRHEFLDDGSGGTILRDDVEYEVPLGWLGQVCGGWFVRRKLRRMFAYRHDVTRRVVESGDFPGA